MTLIPIIMTAHVDADQMQRFDALRNRHFPPGRNFLRAHITLFHRLPGERLDKLRDALEDVASALPRQDAKVTGLQHLGGGVAYVLACPALELVRARLVQHFDEWLVPQDRQPWRPHITVQNKVTKAQADALFESLQAKFQPERLAIIGLDLWHYKGGPWEHEATVLFSATPD